MDMMTIRMELFKVAVMETKETMESVERKNMIKEKFFLFHDAWHELQNEISKKEREEAKKSPSRML